MDSLSLHSQLNRIGSEERKNRKQKNEQMEQSLWRQSD